MAVLAKIYVLTCCLLFLLATTATTKELQPKGRKAGRKGVEIQMPVGLDRVRWRRRIPPDNPMTLAKVKLGEALYFDKRLSLDGTVSCATCHDPANAFTDHTAVAVGVSDKPGTRNAPTVLNSVFSKHLFWDGRASSLEEQAMQPLTNVFEMGMGNNDSVVSRVRSIPEYRDRFNRVFNRDATIETIAQAIATFERTQLSGNSPFDRFLAGYKTAITAAQKRGWKLFKGKAGCIECHSFSQTSPFFTDFKFHNTGVVAKNINFEQLTRLAEEIENTKESSSGEHALTPVSASMRSLGKNTRPAAARWAHTPGFTELGRFLVTRQPKDIGAFKTPTLRDVELTTPYMHNGSEKTLIDVVRFYNRGGNGSAGQDEKMRPLNLGESEMNDLVEFMRALTSYDVLRRTQATPPQKRDAVTPKPPN